MLRTARERVVPAPGGPTGAAGLNLAQSQGLTKQLARGAIANFAQVNNGPTSTVQASATAGRENMTEAAAARTLRGPETAEQDKYETTGGDIGSAPQTPGPEHFESHGARPRAALTRRVEPQYTASACASPADLRQSPVF
jgi:hypothetical protein